MAKGRGATDGWCILRTRGGSTLKLASSLADSGVEAWTPTATITKRKGRARDRVDAPMPILPTFVFVKSVYVAELQRICALVMSPHPAFSIFRYLNRIPVLSDRDISSLKDGGSSDHGSPKATEEGRPDRHACSPGRWSIRRPFWSCRAKRRQIRDRRIRQQLPCRNCHLAFAPRFARGQRVYFGRSRPSGIDCR